MFIHNTFTSYVIELYTQTKCKLQAWCRLGLSHAENENDAKAIAAFNNCLRIQPNNEEVRLLIAVML